MAPNAHLADNRKSHELEMCKLGVEWQKEKNDELAKERDYLKEQLASALKKGDKGSRQTSPLSSKSSSDISVDSSSDTMSDSSSTSSSEGDKKKKRTKKKGKGKKYGKKSKKMETKTRQRAQTPQQVVARYKNFFGTSVEEGQCQLLSSMLGWTGTQSWSMLQSQSCTSLHLANLKISLQTSAVRLNLVCLPHNVPLQFRGIQLEDTIKAFKASGKLLPLKQK
ncbi:uncharacterized protein LOC143751565 isoform X2 [Siphateles boraxobius]